MRRKDIVNIIGGATEGLLKTATDMVLLVTYLSLTHMSVRNAYQSRRAEEEAYRMLDEVNYQTIKRATYRLIAKGLLNRLSKGGREELIITKFGRKRIEEIIPVYRDKRPWDGHLYLISYDIPKEANEARNLLREYIRRTGGALLQESLWINPYNPTQILADFVTEHEIQGSVLVSKLGKDGTIGEETLPELINRVYHLDDLSERYEAFIQTYPLHAPVKSKLMETTVAYLSILKDDPQLPFPLESDDFAAARAHTHYLTLIDQQSKNVFISTT